MNSCKDCMKKYIYSSLEPPCWQLLNLHFSAPKMSDFLILNWAGGRREPNN